MANQLNSDELRRLARLGAQARLEQIDLERRSILAAFPNLAVRRGGALARTEAPTPETTTAAKPRRRRRGRMTAAQRKEVSERMRRYWAERRKGRAKPQKAAATTRRRRPKMTAAQRKEVSERMRRYWAERRKAKGK